MLSPERSSSQPYTDIKALPVSITTKGSSALRPPSLASHTASPSSPTLVESSAFTDVDGASVHIRLTASTVTVAYPDRSTVYEVEDFVGCTTSTRSSLTLALHFYPARESNRSCLGKPNAVPQERDHCELLLTADELKTAELWLVYFNRAARRLPIENTPLPHRNIHILVNPASGRGDGESLKRAAFLTPIFQHANIPFTIQPTTHAGHAVAIARSLPVHYPTSLVCISGDGMLFECINGLLSRADWPTAVRQVTFGIIASGSGNGLAKSLTFLSREHFSLLGQALLIIKDYSRALDVASVIQPGAAPVFSFVGLSWAMMSDIDLLSEAYRWCGDFRFVIASVIGLLNPRSHTAKLSFLTVEPLIHDGKDVVEQKQPLQSLGGSQQGSRRRLLPQGGIACSPQGQCERCLPEGEDGEWTAMKAYLESRSSLDVGSVDLPSDAQRGGWEEVTDQFTLLWALNIPWVTRDCEPAPFAHLSDGLIDLLYIRQISRRRSLRLFVGFNDGSHIHQDELEYCKVKGLRIEPVPGKTERCDYSIDGERVPFGTVELRQWRGILTLHSK